MKIIEITKAEVVAFIWDTSADCNECTFCFSETDGAEFGSTYVSKTSSYCSAYSSGKYSRCPKLKESFNDYTFHNFSNMDEIDFTEFKLID